MNDIKLFKILETESPSKEYIWSFNEFSLITFAIERHA